MKFAPKPALILCLVATLATSCIRPGIEAGSFNESPSSRPSISPSATKDDSNNRLPLGTLVIKTGEGDVRFDVELAEIAEARARGLMGVERLDKIDGMAFLFEALSRGGFWMKNTLIPLDIAFWNEEMTIVDILQMEPCKKDPCQVYTPKEPYIGAVEVENGALAENGVEVGNEVALVRSQ